jgi:hypothetical protein
MQGYERLMATFPNDENGDVLRRMEATGDDMTRSRLIDFSHLLPTEEAAHAFAKAVQKPELAITVEAIDGSDRWDVTVSKMMAPSHADITSLETQLGDHAQALGGQADGWGCPSVVSD